MNSLLYIANAANLQFEYPKIHMDDCTFLSDQLKKIIIHQGFIKKANIIINLNLPDDIKIDIIESCTNLEKAEKVRDYKCKNRAQINEKQNKANKLKRKCRKKYYGGKCIVTGTTDLLEYAHIISINFQKRKGLDAPKAYTILHSNTLFEIHKDNLCLMTRKAHIAWDRCWRGIQNKDTLPFFIAKYQEMNDAGEDDFTKWILQHPSKEYEEYINGLTKEEYIYWTT